MSPLSALDTGPRARANGRRGDLAKMARGLHRNLRLVVECLAMIGLSCSIMACGGIIGFLSNRGVFDSQSQLFAEDSLKLIGRQSQSKPSNASAMLDPDGRLSAQPWAMRRLKSAVGVEGCFGRSRFEMFNPSGFVFASYVCEIEAKGGPFLANLGLRRDPDGWKIIALYVDDPAGV